MEKYIAIENDKKILLQDPRELTGQWRPLKFTATRR